MAVRNQRAGGGIDAWVMNFAPSIPVWHAKYAESHYFSGYRELLARLPAKAASVGYLDLKDLCDIAVWGGNQHGVRQGLERYNTPDAVRARTAEAFSHLDSPTRAIEAVMGLHRWGLTYGSKTLLFMDPSRHAILDSWIRRALQEFLPPTRDGDTPSMVRGYAAFLGICRGLQSSVEGPGPGPSGEWRVADIQQALFQFAQEVGRRQPRTDGSR